MFQNTYNLFCLKSFNFRFFLNSHFPCRRQERAQKEAEEQRRFYCILSAAFSESVFSNIGIIVHPSSYCDECVREPVSRAGNPEFFRKLLDSAVPDQVDIKVTNNTHNSAPNCDMVAELLFDDLINPQDVLVSDLLFLAMKHLGLEFLDVFVDPVRCCLDIGCRCIDIIDLHVHT